MVVMVAHLLVVKAVAAVVAPVALELLAIQVATVTVALEQILIHLGYLLLV
jgi:hypothetical protein